MTQAIRLQEAAQEASHWLFEVAIPLWLERGVDWERGGYYDSLSFTGVENASDFKRLRVTTRQIYVFAEAARVGVSKAQAGVEHGLHFLRTNLRNADGGFAARTNLAGRVIDDTRDLYDLAFSLFAFAHGFRLLGYEDLRTEALNLVDFILERLSHPCGGFQEALPSRLPRRQNPHMHLLEAALACSEHMGDAVFKTLSETLIELCILRFFDAENSAIYEFFSDDLSKPLSVDGRKVTEPGHHFEWIWLFHEAERILSRSMPSVVELASSTLRRGRDPVSGLLFGEVYDNGDVSQASVRLWPHTEWLKATLVSDYAGSPIEAWRALNSFLTPNGLWREVWNAEEQRFEESASPASSLYHITVAVSELRRKAG